jgi:hypothetical protein
MALPSQVTGSQAPFTVKRPFWPHTMVTVPAPLLLMYPTPQVKTSVDPKALQFCGFPSHVPFSRDAVPELAAPAYLGTVTAVLRPSQP